MSVVKQINWLENYRGFIGHLSDEDAERWKNVIRHNLPNVTTQEVDYAVAVICSEDRSSKEKKPNAKSIIDKIIEHRERKSGIGSANVRSSVKIIAPSTGGGHHIFFTDMTTLKQELQNAKSPDEAWQIICKPSDVAQCRALEEYAKAFNVAYKRFVPPQHISKLTSNIARRSP